MADRNIEEQYALHPKNNVELTDLVWIRGMLDDFDSVAELTYVASALAPPANQKSYNGSGTAYQITNTSNSQVSMGTGGAAQVDIDKAGVYYIQAELVVDYNGATFAAVRSLTTKLRRTNNSSADISGASKVIKTRIVTTETSTFAVITLSAYYTTTSAVIAATPVPDSIALVASIDTLPTAGDIRVVSCMIRAHRLQQ